MTRQMVDCLGGENSPSFEFRLDYVQKCTSVYKHISKLFLSLLLYLSRQKLIPLSSKCTKQLEKRFRTNLNCTSPFECKNLCCGYFNDQGF